MTIGKVMEMIDTLGESLNFELKKGQHGRCEWSITHGVDVFLIDMLHIFDSLKDMIYWLNSVKQARTPYDLWIEEAVNHVVTLSSHVNNEQKIVITLVKAHLSAVEQRMCFCVNRTAFCETLENEIVRFFKNDYDPFQWKLQGEIGLGVWVLAHFKQAKVSPTLLLHKKEAQAMFHHVISGKVTLEQADEWATEITTADNEKRLELMGHGAWEGIHFLLGIDLMTEPDVYFHDLADVKAQYELIWGNYLRNENAPYNNRSQE